MNITLTFNEDEKDQALSSFFGPRYESILMDIDNHIRAKLKYQELSKETRRELQEVRDLIEFFDKG